MSKQLPRLYDLNPYFSLILEKSFHNLIVERGLNFPEVSHFLLVNCAGHGEDSTLFLKAISDANLANFVVSRLVYIFEAFKSWQKDIFYKNKKIMGMFVDDYLLPFSISVQDNWTFDVEYIKKLVRSKNFYFTSRIIKILVGVHLLKVNKLTSFYKTPANLIKLSCLLVEGRVNVGKNNLTKVYTSLPVIKECSNVIENDELSQLGINSLKNQLLECLMSANKTVVIELRPKKVLMAYHMKSLGYCPYFKVKMNGSSVVGQLKERLFRHFPFFKKYTNASSKFRLHHSCTFIKNCYPFFHPSFNVIPHFNEKSAVINDMNCFFPQEFSILNEDWAQINDDKNFILDSVNLNESFTAEKAKVNLCHGCNRQVQDQENIITLMVSEKNNPGNKKVVLYYDCDDIIEERDNFLGIANLTLKMVYITYLSRRKEMHNRSILSLTDNMDWEAMYKEFCKDEDKAKKMELKQAKATPNKEVEQSSADKLKDITSTPYKEQESTEEINFSIEKENSKDKVVIVSDNDEPTEEY